MVNAKDMMKRLREEAKAKKILSNCSASSTTSSRSVSAPIQTTTTTSATRTTQQQQPGPSSSSSHQKLWQEKSLFERNFIIEGGTGPGRGTVLRLLEDPMGTLAGGNGATLWDCSLALTRFLAEHYNSHDCLVDKTVLELGAGLGLVGMAMGAMGAQVVATERGLALPLLLKNVEHNEGGTGGRVKVMELSWGKDTTRALLAERDRTGQPSFDIVVGSDLVFPSNADAYPLLADTLLSLLLQKRKTGEKDLELWQSHEPRRPEVEVQFWSMLEDRGILVHRLTAEDGLPSSNPEDIMILRLTLKVG